MPNKYRVTFSFSKKDIQRESWENTVEVGHFSVTVTGEEINHVDAVSDATYFIANKMGISLDSIDSANAYKVS